MPIPGSYEQAQAKLGVLVPNPFRMVEIGGTEPFIGFQFDETTLVRYYPCGLVFGFAMGATMADREVIKAATRFHPGRYNIIDVDGTVAVVSFPEAGDKADFICRLIESGCTSTPILDLYRAAKACFV